MTVSIFNHGEIMYTWTLPPCIEATLMGWGSAHFCLVSCSHFLHMETGAWRLIIQGLCCLVKVAIKQSIIYLCLCFVFKSLHWFESHGKEWVLQLYSIPKSLHALKKTFSFGSFILLECLLHCSFILMQLLNSGQEHRLWMELLMLIEFYVTEFDFSCILLLWLVKHPMMPCLMAR